MFPPMPNDVSIDRAVMSVVYTAFPILFSKKAIITYIQVFLTASNFPLPHFRSSLLAYIFLSLSFGFADDDVRRHWD